MQVMISPIGHIQGIDGRTFLVPTEILATLKANQIDLPIEQDHSGPAIGWIKNASLQEKEGSIWGVVEWNEAGRALLKDRAYRYLSPTYLVDSQNQVITISALGLVNKPNILKQALNFIQGVFMSELNPPTSEPNATQAILANPNPTQAPAPEKSADALHNLESIAKRIEVLEKGLYEILALLNSKTQANAATPATNTQSRADNSTLKQIHLEVLKTLQANNSILPKRIEELEKSAGSPDFAKFAEIYQIEANSVYSKPLKVELNQTLSPLEQEIHAQLGAFLSDPVKS
ncbi:phage protease [Helicobacter cynogastricus]|uniref:phage protease n=1 Tax=Helicobacter cynogastricus TaxID=329937 RepID=UPI000CF12EA9|nr:phage protease [Helicobacter cynogastricus]